MTEKPQCRARVFTSGGSFRGHQCTRAAVVGGEWCKQHDPVATKAARDERRAKLDAAWSERLSAESAAFRSRAAILKAFPLLAAAVESGDMETARRIVADARENGWSP